MEADFSTIAQVYAHSCSIYGVFYNFHDFFFDIINKIKHNKQNTDKNIGL